MKINFIKNNSNFHQNTSGKILDDYKSMMTRKKSNTTPIFRTINLEDLGCYRSLAPLQSLRKL